MQIIYLIRTYKCPKTEKNVHDSDSKSKLMSINALLCQSKPQRYSKTTYIYVNEADFLHE